MKLNSLGNDVENIGINNIVVIKKYLIRNTYNN